MRGRLAVVVAVVAMIAVSGCSSSGSSKTAGSATDTTSASSNRPSACALLTEAEATAAMKVATGPPEENGGGPTKSPPGNTFNCQYHGKATVDLILLNAQTAQGARGDFDKGKAIDVKSGTVVSTKESGAETYASIRVGRIVKGTQEVTVNVQTDVAAAGLTGKSQAEANSYYTSAVVTILHDIAARLGS